MHECHESEIVAYIFFVLKKSKHTRWNVGICSCSYIFVYVSILPLNKSHVHTNKEYLYTNMYKMRFV